MSLLDTIRAIEAELDSGVTVEEGYKPFNSSFSREIPLLQLGWDSTSLGELKTCPRLYYYKIVMGWSPGGFGGTGPENPHLKFGTLYHQATEFYEHQRAAGDSHEEALTKTIRQTLVATISSEPDENGELVRKPWISDEPTKCQKTLIQTIILYLDRFQDDPLKTVVLANGKPAVELSFTIDLAEVTDDEDFKAPSGESYILCGHLDKFASWNDGYWITDKKTTKGYLNDRYFENYSPDNQVSTYDVAGNIVFKTETEGVIIDAAQILVGGSRFMRRPIPRTDALREEWLNDLKFYLRMNEEYVRLDYWPMNDKSCSRFGRRCEFAGICSADPSVREDLLKSFFVKRTWDPLQPR